MEDIIHLTISPQSGGGFIITIHKRVMDVETETIVDLVYGMTDWDDVKTFIVALVETP